MSARESHSCRGYRTGLKRAPYRGCKIVQRPAPDLANWGELPPSACGNLRAIVAPVGDWEGACSCIGGVFLRPLHRMTSPLHVVAWVQL